MKDQLEKKGLVMKEQERAKPRGRNTAGSCAISSGSYKDSQADLQRKDNELTGAILKELQDIIRAYGEREGTPSSSKRRAAPCSTAAAARTSPTRSCRSTTGAGRSVRPACPDHERSAMSGFGYHEIIAILPHRFPFLLIDRVVEFEDGVRIVALKNVSVNEPHFRGHFPEQPLMPACCSARRWRRRARS